MVRRLSGVDDDIEEWRRRARREEQPRKLLGDAGRGVCDVHRKYEVDGVVPRALSNGTHPGPGRRRRKLAAGARAYQAVQLCAVRHGYTFGDLPDIEWPPR